MPSRFLSRVEDYASMPLCFQVEIISDGFACQPLASGGTCDVYQVDLPEYGLVAAKVLHDQDSKVRSIFDAFSFATSRVF